MFQVTDVGSTQNISQKQLIAETAVVAVVLLTPLGAFPALVLTNLPSNSSGPPQGGNNKQQ